MASSVTINAALKNTGWGDRRSELFIEKAISSSKFLNQMTIVDGVKSKAQIPIWDATLTFGSNICDLTDGTGGTIDLGEKEVSVKDITWLFSNCKNTLEGSYRSKLLRKGQLNAQTLDDDLLDWVLGYFSKIVGQELMKRCHTAIIAEMASDDKVTKVENTPSEAILATLEKIYKAVPKPLLEMLLGDADEEYKPVILMNANMIRDYQFAVAAKDTISYNSISKGEVPNYMGLPIQCFNTLEDGEILVMQPANLLLITDEFNDVRAIQNEYNSKKNSDEWFGNFKIGFSYRDGSKIVYKKKA